MRIPLFILFTTLMCLLSSAQENNHSAFSKPNSVFKCYPNPVETELFIVGTHKIKSVEFVDVLGKRAAIYVFNESIIKLDVSYLKSGIYLLQVVDEFNKLETKKLVVK